MDAEKLEMNSRGLLRDRGESSRNTFTVGNGNRPGGDSGTREVPGNRHVTRVPVPAGGAQYRVCQATGEAGAAQPGEAPSISYMEGASLCSAR